LKIHSSTAAVRIGVHFQQIRAIITADDTTIPYIRGSSIIYYFIKFIYKIIYNYFSLSRYFVLNLFAQPYQKHDYSIVPRDGYCDGGDNGLFYNR